jgi:hypothetical protein
MVVDRTFRKRIRGLRDTTGQKLLDVSPDGQEFDGLPLRSACAASGRRRRAATSPGSCSSATR